MLSLLGGGELVGAAAIGINKFNVAVKNVFHKLVQNRKTQYLARNYKTVVKTSLSGCFKTSTTVLWDQELVGH